MEVKGQKREPVAAVVSEAMADINLEFDLVEVKKLVDIPLVANMLAILYPFIREKINYFFSANGLNVFLPPINTVKLVNESKPGSGFTIVDNRKTAGVLAAES